MKVRQNPFLVAIIASATFAWCAFAQIPIAPASVPEDQAQDAKPVQKPDPNQKLPQDAKPAPSKPLIPTTIPTREPPPTNLRPTPPQPGPIEKPADPAKVRATFEMGG